MYDETNPLEKSFPLSPEYQEELRREDIALATADLEKIGQDIADDGHDQAAPWVSGYPRFRIAVDILGYAGYATAKGIVDRAFDARKSEIQDGLELKGLVSDISCADDLDDLLTALRAHRRYVLDLPEGEREEALTAVGFEDLQVWGETYTGIFEGVYSWDNTRVLLAGDSLGADGFAISTRDDG